LATLKEIKKRITAIKSTQKITKAMKMVAAAKLRRAQEKIISARPYVFKMNEIFNHLISNTDSSIYPLMQQREVKNKLYIVISSDRGMCGSFNTNIIKYASSVVKDSAVNSYILSIGKKSSDYFRKNKYNILENYNHISFSITFEIINKIVNIIVKGFLKGEYDSVEIIYNEFKSVARQNLVCEKFLPFKTEQNLSDDKKYAGINYIYEPESNQIINYMIPKKLDFQLIKAIYESNAAEMAARMTAMETATNNAADFLQHLNLQYNRARQESITKELLEIVGGAEALKED
jgi:F-type H+-transporting ATPase subunit gamma